MRRAALAALLASLAFAAGLPVASATAARDAGPGPLQARAAILVEASRAQIAYARDVRAERPIASTTKLMTALLARERLPLDRKLTAAAYRGRPAESVVGLRAGERITVRDLLRALLLPSANDAAVTLARGVAGSDGAFVRLMNRRARELGLRHTHYANPIGLDAPGAHSSAGDLVPVAMEVLRDPFLARTVNMPRAVLRSGAHRRVVVNRNALVRSVPWVDGVKTGHTLGAGYVLVGAARRDGVRLLSVVLGEPSEAARDADTLRLLRWGLERFHAITAVPAGRALATARLAHRDASVELVAARPLRVVVRRGLRVRLVLDAPGELDGPLAAGARVGTVTARAGGRTLGRVPLVTAAPVAKATLGDRARDALGRPWLLLGLAAAVGGTLLIVRARRRDRPPAARRGGEGTRPA